MMTKLRSQSAQGKSIRKFDRRALRGLAIVAKGRQVRRVANGCFYVKSQSIEGCYHAVKRDEETGIGWRCDCQDYHKRGRNCKHIYAVIFVLQLPNIISMNYEALEGEFYE